MNQTAEAIVSAVGETYQINRAELRTPRPSQVRHYVLSFHEIAAGRFRDLEVGCGAVSIVSTFPVVVTADGDPIVSDEDVPAISDAGPLAGWNPSLDPAAVANTILRPGLAFSIRRRIQRLSIEVSGSVVDYQDLMVPGQCHVWLGPSDVETMDFGLPVSHILDNNGASTPINAVTGIVYMANGDTLHRGTVSPASARFWLPSRTELYGILLEWTWTGAAGVLSGVQIVMDGAGGNEFVLTRYAPGVNTPWDYDFGNTIEVPGYQAQNHAGNGLLGVRVTATQSIANMVACLRCKSWL